MNVAIFIGSCSLLVFSLAIWLSKHPLMIGGCVLMVYILGSVVVGYVVSFVIGIFLFLTGVSGMMVAFLYVVALCPNPIFSSVGGISYSSLIVGVVVVGILCPICFSIFATVFSFGVEMGEICEFSQWLRDPYIYNGLVSLMVFLALLLFLCIVSVVSLCGEQEQCLGGHEGMEGIFSSLSSYPKGRLAKRVYV